MLCRVICPCPNTDRPDPDSPFSIMWRKSRTYHTVIYQLYKEICIEIWSAVISNPFFVTLNLSPKRGFFFLSFGICVIFYIYYLYIVWTWIEVFYKAVCVCRVVRGWTGWGITIYLRIDGRAFTCGRTNWFEMGTNHAYPADADVMKWWIDTWVRLEWV